MITQVTTEMKPNENIYINDKPIRCAEWLIKFKEGVEKREKENKRFYIEQRGDYIALYCDDGN